MTVLIGLGAFELGLGLLMGHGDLMPQTILLVCLAAIAAAFASGWLYGQLSSRSWRLALIVLPLGLTPLYLAALVAFVRAPDGRHWESHLLDRYRFSRMVKRAVNLTESSRLERTSKIINLRQEVIPVVDTTLDNEPIRRDLKDIDLPVTIEADGPGLLMAVHAKVRYIPHHPGR